VTHDDSLHFLIVCGVQNEAKTRGRDCVHLFWRSRGPNQLAAIDPLRIRHDRQLCRILRSPRSHPFALSAVRLRWWLTTLRPRQAPQHYAWKEGPQRTTPRPTAW
jgi:hypothetical protein